MNDALNPECVASVAEAIDTERALAARHVRRRAAQLVARSKEPQPPWPRVAVTGHKGIVASMEAAAVFALEVADELDRGAHYQPPTPPAVG